MTILLVKRSALRRLTIYFSFFFFSLPLLSKMELRAEQYESALLTLKEAVKEPDSAKRIMLKKKVGRDGD